MERSAAQEERLALAIARLREGTEVLRTGGGTTLTADQCGLLLDEIESLRRNLDMADTAYRSLAEPGIR